MLCEITNRLSRKIERQEHEVRCQLCHLGGACNTPCMQADTVPNPDVLIVAKAPGNVEDETGVVFSGESGTLLRDLVKECMPNLRIGYTNLVKCRVGHRKLRAAEMNACMPYLVEEIARLKPRLIIALGHDAASYIIPYSRVGKLYTKLKYTHGIPFPLSKFGHKKLNEFPARVLPTYHTAAAADDPAKGLTIVNDLKLAYKYMKTNFVMEHTDLTCIINMNMFIEFMQKVMLSDVIAFDFETTGLYPHKEDFKILGIGICYKKGVAGYIPLVLELTDFTPAEMVTVISMLNEMFACRDLMKVAHNLKFDYACWMRIRNATWDNLDLSGISPVIEQPIFDTMLAHYLIDEIGIHSLKRLAWDHTRLGGYEWDVPISYDEGDTAPKFELLPAEFIAPYCATDADVAFRLKDVFMEELQKKPMLLDHFHKELMPGLANLARMEDNGLLIDMDYFKQYESQFPEKLAEIKTDINCMSAIKQYVASKEGLTEINLNSYNQIREILTGYYGVKLTETTSKGNLSVDKSVLSRFTKIKFVEKLLEYRSKHKFYSTYLQTLPDYVRSDGRIHTTYQVARTKTGRLASKDPNISNIPKVNEIRKMYVAPPGYFFLESDLSQIEPRVLAAYSRDPGLIEVFNSGGDPYYILASVVMGKQPKDVSDVERRLIKTALLGLIYGMSPEGLAERLNISLAKARRTVKWLFEKFPQVKRWIDSIRMEAMTKLEVTTLFGRSRRLPDAAKEDNSLRERALRMAQNAPIQSCAFDIMLMAINRVIPVQDTYDARVVNTIHDSLLLEVYQDCIDEVIDFVVEKMTGLDLPWMPVPLEVEISIGKNWGEMTVIEI